MPARLLAAAMIRTLKITESDRMPEPGTSFLASSMAGFGLIRQHRELRPATLTLLIAVAATGFLNVTLFATISEGLHLRPEFMAVLASVQGLVSVLGGLTAADIVRRLGLARTMILGLVLLALPPLATGSMAVVLVGVSLVGFGMPWTVIAFVTLWQKESPANLQGRTGAATNLLLNVPPVGGSLLAAAVIGFINYRALILAAEAGCLPSILPLLGRVWTRERRRDKMEP